MDGDKINIGSASASKLLEAIAVLPSGMFVSRDRRKHDDSVWRYLLEEKDLEAKYFGETIHIRPLREKADSIDLKGLLDIKNLLFGKVYCDGSVNFWIEKTLYHAYTSPAED